MRSLALFHLEVYTLFVRVMKGNYLTHCSMRISIVFDGISVSRNSMKSRLPFVILPALEGGTS